MNRSFSTFMLIIMLIATVNPTIGLHFCGKDFQYAEVVQLYFSSTTDCCHQPSTKVKDHTDCSLENKSCCETKNIKIVTDKYQLHERINTPEVITKVLSLYWPLLTNSELICTDLPETVLKYFSPKGYSTQSADILSLFCILRI